LVPTQATSIVWGDGNSTNGIPPGLGSDYINAGTIITLVSTVDVPRVSAQIAYDGRDKMATTKPIATTRAQYAVDPGPVLAGAVHAADVAQFGTEFICPVGTNTVSPVVSPFTCANMSVVAASDPTLVYIDINGDGADDYQIWMDEGQPYLITNVVAGTRVRSNKRIKAHLLTGTVGSYYCMRWFTLFPTHQWSSEYYAPVGTRTNSSGSISYVDTYLYNANTNQITVFYQHSSGSGSTNVPARSTARYRMPIDSGAHFYATNNAVFTALCVMDSEDDAHEWGYSPIPTDILTTMGVCAYGRGSRDLTQNGNPVWVSATTNTTLYVDFDCNPDTGAYIDPLGRKYDVSTNVGAYQTVTFFDTVNNDNDQTGTRVYTLSNAFITMAWGQDAFSALTGNPYMDMGCETLPVASVVAEKRHTIAGDNNGNGYVDAGDTLRYTVELRNLGWASASGIVFADELPAGVAYLANSTTTNSIAISDDNTNSPPPYTSFPLDEGGMTWGSLGIGATGTISYTVTVSNPFPTNQNSVANSAQLGSDIGNYDTQDPEVVVKPGLALAKTSSVASTNRLSPGSIITFSIQVQNTGTVENTMVRVDDFLPSGLTYVTNTTKVVFPPGIITNSVRDEFPSAAYANNNGTTNWLNNWQELGDDGNATAGDVLVLTNGVGVYCLRTKDDQNGAWRMADLSGYTNAVLSYKWRRFLLDADDYYSVYASSNGGSTWVELAQYVGNGGTDAGFTSTNIDITGYISTNTAIRFYSPDTTVGDEEGMDWDDIQILFTRYIALTNSAGAPATLTNNLSVSAGQTITVSFQAVVDNPATVTQVVNIARVVSAQYPAPLYSYATNSIAYADLAVSKTVNNSLPNTNELVVFAIVITNLGPDIATNIVCYDIMPTGIAFTAAAASRGSYNGTSGVWQVGVLTNGFAGILVVTGRVNEGTAGSTITNTVVSGGSHIFDPVSSNNQASAVVVVQQCDLGITKGVDNPTPSPGNLITYTLTLTNLGPNDATLVQVTDALPTSLTYSASSPSQGTYSNATGIWNVGTVSNRLAATLTIQATVNAGAGNLTITNTASITRLGQFDTNLVNNTGSVLVAVSGLDLGVTKVVSNSYPNTNDLISYTIWVTNYGPSAATLVRVTDTLPSGVTYVSYATTRGTYTNATGIWDIPGTVTNGFGALLTITARVDIATGGNAITNTATITRVGQSDFNSTNNSASSVLVVKLADLAVLKSADKSIVDEQDLLSYTIIVTNKGPDDCGGIVLYDLLPASLTYSNYTASQGVYSNGTGLWNVGTITNGRFAQLTIQSRVNAGTVNQVVTNIARIQSAALQDPVMTNNTNSVLTTVIDASLSIVKTSSAGSNVLFAGNTNTYTIVVTNQGTVTQTDVRVGDSLPANMTYVAGSCRVTGPRQLTNRVQDLFGSISYGNNDGSTNWLADWSEGGTDDNNPAAGNVRIIAGNMVIDGSANLIQRAVNLAGYTNAVLSLLYRRDGLDNTNDYFAISISSNGVGGTWTEVGRIAGPGTEESFTQTNITVTSYISTNTAVRIMSSAANGANDYLRFDNLMLEFSGRFTTTTNGGVPPDLASGYTLVTNQSLTITFDVLVNSPLSSTQFVNTASTLSSQQLDVVYASVTNMAAHADIGVTKVVNQDQPGPSESIWFTIIATNYGPTAASGVQLTDYWPSQVAFSNASPSKGSYSTANPTAHVWTVGTLAANEGARLVVTGVVDIGAGGTTITNIAWVSGINALETNKLNNTGVVAAVVVVRSADIAVTKTVSNPAPDEGSNVTYTVVVRNRGSSDVTGLELTDLLPEGVSFVSSVPSSGSYNSTNGIWTIGALAVSNEATLSIVVSVDTGTKGTTITNMASISSANLPDPVASNNWDDAAICVNAIEIFKTANVVYAAPGSNIAFTIAITNFDSITHGGVVVTDAVPAGAQFVPGSVTIAVTAGGQTGTTGTPPALVSGGSIPPGGLMTIMYTVVADNPVGLGEITNTAFVSTLPHPVPRSATVVVAASYLDLAVSKTVNNSTPYEGSNIVYTIVVTNKGPLNATGVTLSEPLASGLTYSNHYTAAGSYNSTNGIWTIGSLAASNYVTLAITTRVDIGMGGRTITNTPSISTVDQYDIISTNNSASVAVVVQRFRSRRL